MSKDTEAATPEELEHTYHEETGRRGGLFAVVAVLAIVGLVLWLLMSNDKAT